jgi:hypothetical protein
MSEFRTAPEGAYCSSYYPEFSEKAVPSPAETAANEPSSDEAETGSPPAPVAAAAEEIPRSVKAKPQRARGKEPAAA